MPLQKMTDQELAAINLPPQSVVESGNGIINNAGILTKTGWRPLQLGGVATDGSFLYSEFTDGTNTVFTVSEKKSTPIGEAYAPYLFFKEI